MNGVINGRKLLIFGVVIVGLILLRFYRKQDSTSIFHVSGTTMGSIGYNVKYIADQPEKNLKANIDSILVAFNQSLSTYIPDSEISRFNNNDTLIYESKYFLPVLIESQNVYQITDGAFDPTVMPLVNAWGFGPDQSTTPDSAVIKEIMARVGFEKIKFDDRLVYKTQSGLALDFSAIAKGYAVDIVASYLIDLGIEDIFVEIGGEVSAKGENKISGKPWTVGIEDPTRMVNDRAVLKAIPLNDQAIATSGNYRNFRIEDGVKVHHTISPFTGYPVEHELLSASVFAENCMTADAFATSFMVLGLEKSKTIVEGLDGIDVFFVYVNEQGELSTYTSLQF